MLNPKNDNHCIAITTRSDRTLGPIVETRAEEHDDEEEIQTKLVVANKPVVINVDPNETDKLPVAAKEDECEKEKEDTPKIWEVWNEIPLVCCPRIGKCSRRIHCSSSQKIKKRDAAVLTLRLLPDRTSFRVFINYEARRNHGPGCSIAAMYKLLPSRTSHPRAAKQSDPADKGKEKEKRSAEAEVESGSDPKLEEALRKAKEDRERKAELHRKRGKDALRFNVVPGMKERVFEGMYNWNFNEEK
ncbi:hypothetical protein HAX54_026566 [Datura stramonium]|uniref:Uncharacterized protein n=1 Tax=Datura stramonium TaxID=4076 RepID=A0ABS8V154_DATST|nr:hypothetical protein [Datura stramonium]